MKQNRSRTHEFCRKSQNIASMCSTGSGRTYVAVAVQVSDNNREREEKKNEVVENEGAV